MKRAPALLTMLLLLAATMLAMAVNVTGTWTFKVVLGDQGGSPTFVLKQDGEKLTGTYAGALGDAEVTGTVKGNEIAFDFAVQGAAVHYKGKINDDGSKIEGTCDYGGQASGTFVATRSEAKK